MEHGRVTPDLVALLRSVAEPQRLALLAELARGPRAVAELVEASGLAQASVSHHLAVLRRAGMVVAQRDGRRQRYAWAKPAPGSAEAGLLAWLSHRLGLANAEPRRGPSNETDYPANVTPDLADHLL